MTKPTDRRTLAVQKTELIDKILSMTPLQVELMAYLIDHHEEIGVLEEPARTARMEELKEEFMKNRGAKQ